MWSSYRKPLQEGKEPSFHKEEGDKVKFSQAECMKTNLLWELCAGGGGAGRVAADRGKMFCSQCQVAHTSHGSGRGFQVSLGNFCNLFCQPVCLTQDCFTWGYLLAPFIQLTNLLD